MKSSRSKNKKPKAAARAPRKSGKSGKSKSGRTVHLISADELGHLQEKLREAQETLDAIRCGDVDAVIVAGAQGEQVYSLTGADQPYRVYVERMQEGAVTASTDGVILYCNRRFAEMVGRPLDRVIGSPLQDRLPLEAWHRVAEVFDSGTEIVKCETTLQRPAEAALPVTLTASRLSLNGPTMMCLVVTDLTAQKETTNLRMAKEVAERASEAKDNLLAALSHELRTPLTPALMAATVLEKDTGLPESVRSDIALIRRNVELEARLIDDLLDLTLITRGKLVLQTDAINLHACLNRALEICQDEARQKRLILQIELSARHTLIRGDPVRAQQACWNVLRNAVKFTPPRGTISIRTGNDDAGQVWIRVTDTGIGFSPDQVDRIFEAFEHGSRSINRQFGGLGLGLAISRSIMHAHGGTIAGHSPGLNQGATFTLSFPLLDEARPVAAASSPGPTRKLNILLVEDHTDTRMCIQRLLESSAHKITSAGTAQDALTLAEAGGFDLVISDLGLPDLDGHELMRRLHDRMGLPGIALSGYGTESDLNASRQAGFKYHLTKPVSFERLQNFVAEFAAGPEKNPVHP